MSKLFLDCDGVLADFDRHFVTCFGRPSRQFEAEFGAKEFWYVIRKWRCPDTGLGFFETVPLMPDATVLLAGVAHLDPIILTGAPFGPWAEPQKRVWRERHIPQHAMIVCLSKEKILHMQPGDIIIDDWPQHRALWEGAGGIWIPHTSAEQSLADLRAIRPDWF